MHFSRQRIDFAMVVRRPPESHGRWPTRIVVNVREFSGFLRQATQPVCAATDGRIAPDGLVQALMQVRPFHGK